MSNRPVSYNRPVLYRIVFYCIVTVLYIIFQDPTEKHFGEVGIFWYPE